MKRHDRLANVVTLTDEIALHAWDQTIENVLSHAAATPASLAVVLEREPFFALGLAAKGIMLLTLARGELRAPAAEMLKAARASAAQRPITRREAAYADALGCWLVGDPAAAASRLEAILVDHPRDVLALKFAQAIRFMIGDRAGMMGALARHGGAFAEDVPLAGYVMGCRAFALEEAGAYGVAERVGRRAIELEPKDAWGRHAVAHVMEMTGRVADGIAFLSGSTDRWAHCNNFGTHMFWHLALLHLETGAIDRVFDLYDGAIRAQRTDDYRDIANAASLLARLEIEGVDVGDRWSEIGEIAARRVEDRQLVFGDLHYLLALLRSGNDREAGQLVHALSADATAAASYDDRVAASVGLPAAQGLVAFEAGDHAEAARLLGAARPGLVALGGSNAQRDLFEQIYIESLVGCGRLDEAAAVARTRAAVRGRGNRVVERVLRASRRAPAIIVAGAAIAAHRIPQHH